MPEKIQNISTESFFNKVAEVLKQARKSVVTSVNSTMVLTYFKIDKMIVEEKGQILSDEFKLSWSHYLKLLRIDNENKSLRLCAFASN